MKSYWNAIRQFDRSVVLYLFYWSMVSFGYFGVVGVLMNLYLLRLGYDTAFIGLVIGSGQLVWGAFALPAGMIGYRVGAKRAMVAGMVLIALGTGLMLTAELLPDGQQQVVLVLFWMLSWVGAALSAVNSTPFLMSVTDDNTRGFAFSAQQTVMAAAGFAGSIAAGVLPGLFAGQLNSTLDDPAPYRMALLLAPLAYLAAAGAISRAKVAAPVEPMEQSPEALKAPIGLFLFIGLMIGLQAFSEGIVRAFFNIYLDTRLSVSTELIGGIMGMAQLLLILISLIIPAMLVRWKAKGSLTITTLGMAAFILLLAWAPSLFGASFAYVGITGMLTVMATSRGIFSQESVSLRWRTMSSSVATVGLALGWASAAWLGGALVDILGFQGLFLLGALFALLSAGMLMAHGRRVFSPKGPPTVIAITGEAEEVCQ